MYHLLAALLHLAHPVTLHTGIATTFNIPELDPWNVGGFACEGRVKLTPLQRKLIASGAVVAHKTLDCGEVILVCVPRVASCALALVWDRGPRVALLDLWHDLSKLLKHNGKEPIVAFTFTRGV